MKKRYFLGNDIAKETFDFCLLNRKKVCLWRGQLSNNAAGFKALFEGLKARGFKLKQIHFAQEATGVYGRALMAALHAAGLAVSELNPARSSSLAIPIIGAPRTIGSMPSSLPSTAWNASRWLPAHCGLWRDNSKC
jgi:hypothetical protein